METTPRRRGRPRIAEGQESSELAPVTVPAAVHDEVCRMAIARGCSVAQIVRDALFSHLKNCRRELPATP